MSQIAVITGATRGIGRMSARELARAGRSVVLLCRDPGAGEAGDENQSVCPASALARDVAEQERLGTASERWVGLAA